MLTPVFARCARRASRAALLLSVLLALDVAAADSPPQEMAPMLQLGPGDAISIHVYGQPDMDATQYVADDGSIRVALAGSVAVGGLSPAEAGGRVERALESGKYLVNPHVTITVAESRSQRVSVLGEVRSPGRYTIETNTSVFDVLALAGGATENGNPTVYILRPGPDGVMARYSVNLEQLAGAAENAMPPTLRAGDSLYVPRANSFYIHGEVRLPNMYRLEPGMTVLEAIARAGGLTLSGSEKRIEISRRDASGAIVQTRATLADPVNADDVIRVKWRLF